MDDKDTIIWYSREQRSQPPVACFAAIFDHGHKKVTVGWSLCSHKDQFNKKIGRAIAIGRARLGSSSAIATESLIEHLAKFMKWLDQTSYVKKLDGTYEMTIVAVGARLFRTNRGHQLVGFDNYWKGGINWVPPRVKTTEVVA